VTLTESGGTVSTTTIYVRLAATTTVGSYSGNVVLTSAGSTTENVATASSTVSKATLTVTAENKSVTYGDATPTLTYTITGFVNSENQGSATTGSPSLST